MERTLVISDLHVPYHDPQAFELVLEVIAAWVPDNLIVNGDLFDAYSVSRYDKDPERMLDGGLQEEADCARRLLRRLKSTLNRRTRVKAVNGERKIVVKPGNHEERVAAYLWRHPELFGIRALRIPDLLGLKEEGIAYEENDILLAKGALHISHGTRVRQKAGYTATAELEAVMYGHGTITGHTHRLGTVFTKTPEGVVSASEGGCLCGLKPAYARKPNWQHGVTLVYSGIGTTEYHVQSVPFLNGVCVIEGQRIQV
jgi:predicted phosphodiesterase